MWWGDSPKAGAKPSALWADKAVTRGTSPPSTHGCESRNTSGILRGAFQDEILWGPCPDGFAQERPGLDVETSLSLEAQPSNLSFLRNLAIPSHRAVFTESALRREKVRGCGGWSRALFCFLGPLQSWNAVFRWEVRGCWGSYLLSVKNVGLFRFMLRKQSDAGLIGGILVWC